MHASLGIHIAPGSLTACCGRPDQSTVTSQRFLVEILGASGAFISARRLGRSGRPDRGWHGQGDGGLDIGGRSQSNALVHVCVHENGTSNPSPLTPLHRGCWNNGGCYRLCRLLIMLHRACALVAKQNSELVGTLKLEVVAPPANSFAVSGVQVCRASDAT